MIPLVCGWEPTQKQEALVEQHPSLVGFLMSTKQPCKRHTLREVEGANHDRAVVARRTGPR